MITRRTLLASTGAVALADLRPPDALAQAKQDDTTFAGFRRGVMVRWGDRVDFDAPPFTPAQLTADATQTQFGWDASIVGISVGPPADDGVPRGVMTVLHPTAEGRMMFPGGQDRPEIAVGAQGASILNLARQSRTWEVVDGGFQSRRLTARTLCAITGPATASVGASIQGVLALATGCVTPWGTVLMAEGDPEPWFARLQDRDPTLPTRARAGAYGWVVELDPFNPQAMPAKRTALGRFARMGLLATKSADGRAVVFMSDDRASGFLFRFVSDAPAEAGNPDLLDSGTLSVAVNEGGWSVGFAALPKDVGTLIGAVAAARAMGAAVFDGPAGMAQGDGGTLILTCRGVAARANPDALNPRPQNPDGHVVLFRPDGRDPAATVFAGEIALLCGGGPVGWMSRPSSIARSGDGSLWIGTEASGIAVARADFTTVGRVYAPPVGAAMGGVAVTPDGTTLLSAVRHPGATPGASFDRPATRWPSLLANMPPQTTIVTLTRG